MYAREVNGQVLDFGVSGKLYRNVLVMFDRQTGSLWSQLLGQAIVGPLTGTRLTMLPATVITWGAWRREHPDGLMLRKEEPSKATYASYWNSGTIGVAGETLKDSRLLAKQYVVGVRVADQPKAYPYARLSTQPVVNDTLGGTPLVVVFDEAHGGAGIVFSRQVQGPHPDLRTPADDGDDRLAHGRGNRHALARSHRRRLGGTARRPAPPAASRNRFVLVRLEGSLPQHGRLGRVRRHRHARPGNSCPRMSMKRNTPGGCSASSLMRWSSSRAPRYLVSAGM